MVTGKTDINSIISGFERDMNNYPYGYNEDNIELRLQEYLDCLRGNISVEEAAKFSKKALWRLVSSIIRNTGRNNKRAGMCRRLLQKNIPYFRLDIATKCTALNKMKKFGIRPGEELEGYLGRKTWNDIAKPGKNTVGYTPENYKTLIAERLSGKEAQFFAPGAFRYVMGLFKKQPDMDLKVFDENLNILFTAAGKIKTGEPDISFRPLYAFMQKKAASLPNTVSRNLFDDTLPATDTIHKRCVQLVALNYARCLYRVKDMKNIGRLFPDKFGRFLQAVVRKNSFSRDEVKQLAKYLQSQSWTSRSVERHVNRLSADLVDIFDKKQAEEIRQLNRWFYKFRKDGALSEQAVEDVYIRTLYDKLVNSIDIKTEKLNKNFYAQRAELKKEIAVCGAKTHGETAEEVLKYHHEANVDKADVIQNYLNKKCKKCSFYEGTNYIFKEMKLLRSAHAPSPVIFQYNDIYDH